jgi:MarR family transcriptional regulator for hemolysin
MLSVWGATPITSKQEASRKEAMTGSRPPNSQLEARHAQAEIMLEMSRLSTQQDRCVSNCLSAVGITSLTPAQSRVLMILFQARQALTARELARRMGVSEPTMSRFVRALTTAGWIEKSRKGEDRRAWHLSVTPYAREQFPLLAKASNMMLDHLFGGFEGDDLQQLHRLIDRVRSNLESPNAP